MRSFQCILVCSFCVFTTQSPVRDINRSGHTDTMPIQSTESWINRTTHLQDDNLKVISSKATEAETESKSLVPIVVPAIILAHIVLFVAVFAIAKRARFREAIVSMKDRLQCRRPPEDDMRLVIDDDDSNC